MIHDEVYTGTIKNTAHLDKGYVFLSRDDGDRDVFAHVRYFLFRKDEITPGMRVRFQLQDGTDGRTMAANVELVAEPVPSYGSAA